jgi:3'(2'), 5'-bisphosphate nucleotidase
LTELLESICGIARRAGAVIMPYFDGDRLDTRRKADRSQVTAADEAAERLILAELSALTPDVPIVAEEEVAAGRIPDVSAGRFWLVDPLDGTKEFIQAIPEFTVNIGLVENGRPVLGVVYSPASDDLYAGTVGERYAFVERGGAARERIEVRPFPPEGLTICLSRTYGSSVDLTRFLERFAVAEQIDAGSSIKFCLIARGRADVYPRYGGSMEWDTAAAHAVLAAAGGSVRLIDDGPELTYGKPGFRNPYFIAWGDPDHAPRPRGAGAR